MTIENINISSTGYSQNTSTSAKVSTLAAESNTVSTLQRTDKLDISKDVSRMKLIETRLKSGYYDKPEIMKETAKQISYSIPPETF